MKLTAFAPAGACQEVAAREGNNKNTWLAMKLTSILLLTTFLQVSAHGLAQDRVTFSGTDVPFKKVMDAIQNQAGYVFFYNYDLLQSVRNVDLDVKNASVEDILNKCLKDQPVTYAIHEKTIVLKKKVAADMAPASLSAPPVLEGLVRNEAGTPLAGATVTVVAGNFRRNTMTDERGRFSFKDLPAGNYTVELSYIGRETVKKLVSLAEQPVELSIVLSLAASGLDESVVKGYYTTTRRFNTGDVSTVKGEDIAKQPVSDPVMALEGRVPGLYITEQSGVPGSEMHSVLLRGQNSIANGNMPLFIVDGIPVTNNSLTSPYFGGGAAFLSPFNTINPSDIESIDVLKDADATAIYGSRGANGVILITTKRGKTGKTKFEASAFTGTGAVARKIKLLNTSQYLDMRHEAFANDGKTPGVTDYDINGSWDTTRYTDWQKVLIGGTSRYDKYQATLSGGSEYTQFLFGGSFGDQTTVYPGAFADKTGSVHLNLTHASPNRRLRAAITASYAHDNSNLPAGDLTSGINLAPDAPALYKPDGTLNWQQNSSGVYTFTNPVRALQAYSRAITDDLTANATLSYRLFGDLQLQSSFGYNKIDMHQNVINPIAATSPANANNPIYRSNELAENLNDSWIIEPQANYKRAIGKGQLDALIGGTIQQNLQNTLGIYAYNFSSDALINNILAASVVQTVYYTNTQYRYSAVYGRIGYNWQEKYLINFTARRDGSSRFGPGRRFGDFGSVGAGWIFSQEAGVRRIFPFLSFGKLRVSYGTTGNDQMPDYQYLSAYSAYSYPYQGSNGLYPTNLLNPNYRWELDKKAEVGLDLGFLQNRILFSGAYYINRSSNQLVGYSLPTITGFSSITANLPAIVQNSGAEFTINTTNIKKRDFSWTTMFNISLFRNKLIAYPNLAASSYANTYTVGKSLFSKKGYHYTGVDPTTGTYTFEDVNKDGQIGYPQDYATLKPITQQYFGGIQNDLQYKSFELSVFLQFVKQTGRNYFSYFNRAGTLSNEPVYVLSRWQHAGDHTNVQKFSQNNATTTAAYSDARSGDYSYVDASFVRVKNIALSYSFPAKSVQRAHLQGAKIYLQGQNLFTITRYQGLDPENQGFLLPPLRMIVAGAQLSL